MEREDQEPVGGMTTIRGSQKIGPLVLVTAALLGVLACSELAIIQRNTSDHLAAQLAILALLQTAVSIPVNLLAYSSALIFLARVKGTEIGTLHDTKWRFVWSSVLAVIIASTVGAFVSAPFADGGEMGNAGIAMAVTTLFLSTIIVSRYVVGLENKLGTAASGIVAGVSLHSLLLGYPWDIGVLNVLRVVILATVLDVMALAVLSGWYGTSYSVGRTPVLSSHSRLLLRLSLTYFSIVVVCLITAFSVLYAGDDDRYASNPYATLTSSYYENQASFTVSILSVAPDFLVWNDVAVLVDDGTSSAEWWNISSEYLSNEADSVQFCGFKDVGEVEIMLNVTDVAGNGQLDDGDYLTLHSIGFTGDASYSVTLVYEPTANPMVSIVLTV